MKRTLIVTLVVVVVAFVAIVTLYLRNAYACEGEDLQRTRQIVETAWNGSIQLSLEMARTGDFSGTMQRMIDLIQRMNYAASQLPPSCQALIQQWANSMQGAYGGGGGGGAQCMGGVCCDQSGCY